MAGAGYRNESYAKLGMGRFTSWFRPPGVPEVKRPADLDGVFHDAKTNRFILFEFKPANRQPDGTLQLSEPTQGQQITLRGFSRLPGCLSILIFDPAWNKQVQKYNDQQPLVVWVWNDGERAEHNITLEQLNGTIAKWYERRELPFESGSPA